MVKLAEAFETDKVMMRETAAAKFTEFAETDPRFVYLDSDLASSFGMSSFGKNYPDKFINCGIQEGNMIGVAAGLSAAGMVPFTHTFAAFASRRVADQIFISVAYAKNNVKMFASDPGVVAATNGGTHMPFEDVSMMRAIPTMTIIEPADNAALADLMPKIKDAYGPFYIRVSRKDVTKIYEDGSEFEIGKAVMIRDGKDVTLIGAGIMVHECIKAAELLEKEGIQARVLDMFTIKPIDVDAVVKAAKDTGAIVTAENHNIIGGLGSAVCEAASENCPVPVLRVGVMDEFGEVGPTSYLKTRFGLTAENIAETAKKAIKLKK